MIRSAFTKRFLLIPFCVFFLFLIATFFAWKITSDVVDHEEKDRFYQNAADIKNWAQERVDLYILAIEGLHGLFAVNNDVSRNEWARYIQRIRLLEKYPGISSISYIKKLDNKDKKTFIESIRKDTSLSPKGYPTFTIYPEANKEIYYVVSISNHYKAEKKD